VGSADLSEAIKFLLGDVVPCDDYGLVVTSELLVEGGVERCSTNAKPMAIPNKTINPHTHHFGCFFWALGRLLRRRPSHRHSELRQ